MDNAWKDSPHGRRSTALSSKKHCGKDDAAQFDPDLMRTLVERRGQFLLYLQNRLSDRDEAEDFLQDFYVRVLTKADQIRDRGSTVAWLYTVLKSMLADRYRRKASERNALQLLAANQIATAPVQDVTLDEVQDFDRTTCTCFYHLLPALKPEYADALSRVELAELSPAEAARDIGITAGNMRVRLHRARRALRKALERSCGGCREHGCFTPRQQSHQSGSKVRESVCRAAH